eukprot:m.113026 g.113026  ORF g.113026 m.113026 type:complete len:125 (-) comp19299_c0_seq5:30-404(-)
MTHQANHDSKALAVNQTWGAGCDKLLFMSTEHAHGLETVVLDLGRTESRATLWRKSIQAWMYVFGHYANDYDWFMRADDDSYVNMDNLRSYLDEMDPNEPHYLGRKLKSVRPVVCCRERIDGDS